MEMDGKGEAPGMRGTAVTVLHESPPLPWLYHIRVWPQAPLEAKALLCLAEWKIASVACPASLPSSTVCQYSEDKAECMGHYRIEAAGSLFCALASVYNVGNQWAPILPGLP